MSNIEHDAVEAGFAAQVENAFKVLFTSLITSHDDQEVVKRFMHAITLARRARALALHALKGDSS